jgi:hypothetical protein
MCNRWKVKNDPRSDVVFLIRRLKKVAKPVSLIQYSICLTRLHADLAHPILGPSVDIVVGPNGMGRIARLPPNVKVYSPDFCAVSGIYLLTLKILINFISKVR